MIDEKKLIEKIQERIEIHEKDYQAFKNYSGDRKIKDIAKLDECTVIIDLIKNQPKVGEWIPFEVTEADEEDREAYGFEQMLRGKLPEEDEEILVTYSNGHVGEDVFLRDGYECYLDSGAEFVLDAVAWMPLPEPYKE